MNKSLIAGAAALAVRIVAGSRALSENTLTWNLLLIIELRHLGGHSSQRLRRCARGAVKEQEGTRSTGSCPEAGHAPQGRGCTS